MREKRDSYLVVSCSILLCLVVFLFCTGCVQSSVAPTSARTTSADQAQTQLPTTIPTAVSTQQTAVSSQTLASANSDDFVKYTNSQYGFSILYPDGWQVNEGNPDIGAPDGLSGKHTVVDFYSPAIKRCDSDGKNCIAVRSQMTVGVDDTPGTNEISEYYVKDVARLSTDYPIKITKNSAQIELNWGRALRLDYELNGQEIKVIREYVMANGKVYVITFHSHFPKTVLDLKTKTSTNEPDMMEMYLDDILTSLKSFTPSQGALTVI